MIEVKEVEGLNSLLNRLTIVERLEFRMSDALGEYSITLDLIDDERGPYQRIRLNLKGVGEFRAAEFGGGITQIGCLRIRDIHDLQHDRYGFILEDLEDRTFFLKCRRWSADFAEL